MCLEFGLVFNICIQSTYIERVPDILLGHLLAVDPLKTFHKHPGELLTRDVDFVGRL